MIILVLLLLSTTATQPFLYPHIPPFGVFAPQSPILNPEDAILMLPPVEHHNLTSIIDTNSPCPDVDCNYIDANGNCVLMKCPSAPTSWTLSWNVDQSEPSQSEVWHTVGSITNWNILAIVNGSSLTISNLNQAEHFRVRSTVPGYISEWNTQ